jgi:fructokinase
VLIANDADCFALAEATLGAGRGYRTVFGVIMGTGVGGGIVVDGRLLLGPNGIAGEWGHTTLVPDGNPCYCGRRGCVETYISGPAVERSHRARTGVTVTLADIARDARADPECEQTIRTMCGDFGRAIAQVINVVDPHAVVLGGGAGQVSQLRTWGVEEAAQHVFNTALHTPFLAPELGDSAGVIGAALLARGPIGGSLAQAK